MEPGPAGSCAVRACPDIGTIDRTNQLRAEVSTMIDETIGHYRIEKVLGQGGMGVVYLAQDLTLPRKVAIKVIAEDLLHDPSSRGRLMREAQIAASLDHPFICRIFEIVEERDQLFLVMELVTGVPLNVWVQEEQRSLDDVLRVGSEIAEAISAAHNAGVIHRDIKPANILVTTAGHPKIMDFGLAKALAEGAASHGDAGASRTMDLLTRTGVIMGTYGYLAPEVLRGSPPSVASDVFSLGCVLYYMATRDQPFAGDTPVDGISRTLTHVPDPPSHSDPRLPPGFDQLVSSAMEKTPEKRPSTAEEMRSVLTTLRQQSASFVLDPAAARGGGTPASSRGSAVPAAGQTGSPAATPTSVLDRLVPAHPKRRSRMIAIVALSTAILLVIVLAIRSKQSERGVRTTVEDVLDATRTITPPEPSDAETGLTDIPEAVIPPVPGVTDTIGIGNLVRLARELEEREKRGEEISPQEIAKLFLDAGASKMDRRQLREFLRARKASKGNRAGNVVFPPGFPFVDTTVTK
jgi:serine/threonine-protein kinase